MEEQIQYTLSHNHQTFATQHSLSNINNITCCSDNLLTCEEIFQSINTAQLSDVVTNPNARGLRKYSKEFLKEISNRLLLPIEVDSTVWYSNCYIGSFKSINTNSWFSITERTTQTQTCSSISCPCTVLATLNENEDVSNSVKHKKTKKAKQQNTESQNEQPCVIHECSFISVKNNIGTRCRQKCAGCALNIDNMNETKENEDRQLHNLHRCKQHCDKQQEDYKYIQGTTSDANYKTCNELVESKVYKAHRVCGDVCLMNMDVCAKHLKNKLKEQETNTNINTKSKSTAKPISITQNVCEFEITQYARKGLRCGDFCQPNSKYCKQHVRSVHENGVKVRTFKVRIYPTRQEQKLYTQWFLAI